MYAITGITGKVGATMARTLLDAGAKVRAVVRNPEKAGEWAALGCEIAVADMGDEAALTKAFTDAEGAFILPPPNFDPLPGFPEARAEADIIRNALENAKPGKVLCLSTIGAQASQSNLLTQRTILEQALGHLSMPLTILRPGWFLDNLSWDVASARNEGVVRTFLQPEDRPFPMVSTEDVGRVAAELILQDWKGRRIVELDGPARISPRQIAAIFSELLGRPVRLEVVPRENWGALFRSQGMRDPMPRIQMLDGFNEGWIEFEGPEEHVLKGKIDARKAIERLLNA
ncbi:MULTISPECIES: NmrA family NAD(P)-binding protein [unclassified Sinorhizobium]|uniref:NmrA family NAD(P)-binding protein n=1 Tax=unclassified Sinorhizobium TaxID=2613772 RepID=UPI0035247121